MKAKLLLLLLLANLSIYAQLNLVPNGDFETWTSSSQPNNWFGYFNGMFSKNTNAQSGLSSTNMTISTGTFNYMNSEYFSIQAGKTYRITLYHKTISGSFSSIDLSIYHKPGTFKEKIAEKSDIVFSNTEWRKIEFEYTSTSSENIEVDIWTTGTLNSEILVDNVSVVDIAGASEQYTSIPDVNFEKKLIALNIDSGEPDGKILTSKISSIKDLDLYNSKISDLTGIEGFQSLTNLSCMSNKITSIDISKNLALTNLNAGYNKLTTLETSKNIALQYLALSYNEITSLNISQNVNLSILSCQSNKLSTIDVSNNKKLTLLSCSSNELSSLDVSKNTSLSSLQCAENKSLTNVDLRNGNNKSMQIAPYVIDFTKNPLLTCILVDNPIYSNEKWGSFKDAFASYSTVDCSQITAIVDPVFEDKLIALNIDKDGKNGTVLNSSIANLTSLNVASSSIKDLTGIKGFTNLTSLNCSDNLLISLDLSKNTVLTVLNSSNNKLLNLNLKNGNNINFDLSSSFKNNPDLNCIQVDDEVLSTNNWSSLKDNSANYSLDCNVYTLIPDSNFEDKLIALKIDKDGKNGKVLTSSLNKVASLDLQSSSISNLKGIEDFQDLVYLDCKYNALTNINVKNNKKLRGLDLHDNKLSSLDISENTELFSLTFSKNKISTIDLSQNKKLHYVGADQNLLSSIDFSSNNELESIYCGNNNLTSINVSNLPNLLTLNCTYTNISKLDVTANTKLEMLYFNNAKLTTIDLKNNPLLKRINLSNNELTTLDISKNPLLELVFIEFNPITTLNLQNGNNENFILPSANVTNKSTAAIDACSFLNNKNLSCIQVDNVEFSNSKWSKIKEPTATYSNTCKNLGIENSVFNQAALFPNPTKGEVHINNIALDKASVYNSLGQLVKSFTLNSASTDNTINLSGLPKGVYYIYLINGEAASAKKVIVE
ncbi:T9SS type A sorting domain-containing protein [Flavobacterium sp. 2]|uniref:T9SS type A sorting domain-containing protein n=1 Tax=Flavobacterium sp. 2 TaxID=308053 RepID=UPI000C1A487F|nr:T9SS type A sorting domain-containing protein [Flavobacterium sp. 2]PIF69619.1 putative secreted protein (Por secretion system target) [Flavobacterium sp. 2]